MRSCRYADLRLSEDWLKFLFKDAGMRSFVGDGGGRGAMAG